MLKKKYCGAGITALFIPEFIFSADCKKHDSLWAEQGGFMKKIYADVMFYGYMLHDILAGEYSFIRRWFYFLMATIYFVAVSTDPNVAIPRHIYKGIHYPAQSPPTEYSWSTANRAYSHILELYKN